MTARNEFDGFPRRPPTVLLLARLPRALLFLVRMLWMRWQWKRELRKWQKTQPPGYFVVEPTEPVEHVQLRRARSREQTQARKRRRAARHASKIARRRNRHR